MLDRTVRVFISSTFRDFGEERDLLMKRVFPELRRRARDRFVQVIGVDLRWGVTEEDSQQGETLPICLREIERSRPYFIGLLGERYGWTPNAGQYPELLLAQQPWLAAHAGGTSVTELEVLHGVLNNLEMAGRAFFYFRDAAWSDAKGPEFRSEGAEDQAKLARLKDGIRTSDFPVVEYATPEAVADRITDDLWALIDQQYPEDAVPDELERERRSHEAYAAERRRLYVGQDGTVDRLLARLEDASDEPGEDGSRTRITLVTGESGTGKSALLANTLTAYRAAHPNDVVIEHYIGSTSDASDPVKLMRRVAEEIKRLTGSTTDIEKDEEKLVEQFATWIADASNWAKRQGVRFVLVLDALDKLESHANMRWLPRKVLPHIRIVASSLHGEARDALVNRGAVELEAALFSADIARRYVTETLAHRGRKLPAYELDRIIAHPKSTLPLFLKTLVEELSVFGSYEGLPTRISECLAAQEPDDLFEIIFARLEDDFGRELVQKPLEAIAASSDGMSDDELLRFTGLTPLALARLKLALDDTLYEAGGLIRMSHAYAQKGVQDRYMPNDEARRSIHRELGLWWEVQEIGARAAVQIHHHLGEAKAWPELRKCLVTPRTGVVMLRSIDAQSLFRSWSAIAGGSGVGSVGDCIAQAFELMWESWRTALRKEVQAAQDVLDELCELMSLAECHGVHAGVVANDMLDLAMEQLDRLGTAESRWDVSTSLCRIAGIEKLRGNLDRALATYEECLGIERAITEELNTPKSRRSLSISLRGVAHIDRRRGNLDSAFAKHEECLGIWRALAQASNTPESRREVSVSLVEMADIERQHGDLDSALVKYEEGVSLLRMLAQEINIPASRRDLSKSLRGLAALKEEHHDIGGALAILRESLGIDRELMEELNTPNSRRDVSVSLCDIADIEQQRGDVDSALAKFEECLAISRALVQEVNTPNDRTNLRVSLRKIAEIEQQRGDIDSALAKFKECLGISRALVQEINTLSNRRDLSICLCEVANVEQERGDLDLAFVRFEECLGIDRALMEELNTPGSRREVIFCLDRIADIETRRCNFESALSKYKECLGISRGLLEAFSDPTELNNVVWYLHICADCLHALDRSQEAFALLTSDEQLAQTLEESAECDASNFDTCAAFRETFASICTALGQPAASIEHSRRAADLRKRIASAETR